MLPNLSPSMSLGFERLSGPHVEGSMPRALLLEMVEPFEGPRVVPKLWEMWPLKLP